MQCNMLYGGIRVRHTSYRNEHFYMSTSNLVCAYRINKLAKTIVFNNKRGDN